MNEVNKKQSEDCAFWLIETAYGHIRSPIDSHAVYAYSDSKDRIDIAGEGYIPLRNALRDRNAAIRVLGRRAQDGFDDKVKTNLGGWMETTGYADEGFKAVYENGSVEYKVQVPLGGDWCQMRKVEGLHSVGIIDWLEVNWDDGR